MQIENVLPDDRIRTDYRRRPVFGHGINDLDMPVTVKANGKTVMCPFYRRWSSMLMRCYSEKHQKTHAAYIGCTVAPEWHRFSVFRNWMEKQNWQGMQLDKDFLSDSKVYGPENCVFIPYWLNSMFTGNQLSPEGLPRGVNSTNSNRYEAFINAGSGRDIYLGRYDTPEEAHLVYLKAKYKHVRSKYPEIALIDPRLIEACERKLRLLGELPE
jgi:hypothetical protein